MDIQALSMDMAAAKVQEQVGVSMLAKGLDMAQERTAALFQSLAPLPEGSGAIVDLLA